ncbi:Vacuolar protein sorting-associated protein 53 -like protein [Echinococcus granulosus]|nr:Vacuolar protein sorting-associated protein 53 -like protein [Echinococcus granulosus]
MSSRTVLLMNFTSSGFGRYNLADLFLFSPLDSAMEAASSGELPQNDATVDLHSVLRDFHADLDPIDAEDFDVVHYINELFPSEQSLPAIDDIIASIQEKLENIDAQTRQIVRGQWTLEEQGERLVSEASDLIQSLFAKIREVQKRATSSELMVAEITKDIQQLDHAKRNLTGSITTLNNLALIVGDVDHLNATLCINTHALGNGSSSTNPFGLENAPKVLQSAEIEDHLARAQRLMEPMMAAYSSVPAIVELNEELKNIYTTINSRLFIEMRELLASPSARILTEYAPKILTGCRLLDLLPTDNMKMEIINWFITQQLAEYRELYEPSQAIAWLDKIDHRYAWLRTNVTPLERKIRTLFPQEWLVLERLIVEFCRNTRADLEVVMQRRRAEITHNLLVFAMQRTIAFESSLSKIATGAILLEEQRKSEEEKELPKKGGANAEKEPSNPFDKDVEAEEQKNIAQNPKSQQSASPFEGIISNCFAPYFDLYLNNIERALNDQLTTRLIGDYTMNKSSLKSRAFGDVFRDGTAPGAPASGDLAENTLYSATDLFLLYKQLLKQTLQLTRGQGLLGLVGLLRKYLGEYTEKVLLPGIPGLTSNSSSGSVLTKPFSLSSLASLGLSQDDSSAAKKDSITFSASNFSNQFFTNFLREDQPMHLSNDEVIRVCVIIVTATYCMKTVEELEKRLKAEVRPASLAGEVSFGPEVSSLTDCRSACVHRLVADLEASVVPQLTAMTRMPWASLSAVGDQSPYVTAIIAHLKSQVPLMRDTLFSVRAHFTQICIKFADAIINRFVASLYRCKPLNTFGAEQLLLDTQCLKSALLQLPLFGTKITQQPPRTFTALVQEGMAHAERIIKSVMLPIGSPAGGTSPPASVPTTSVAAGATTNPFDTPAASDAPPPPTPTGFVMGPISSKAADAFVKSFLQLIPTADQQVLQKVMDMKGIKRSDQFVIIDEFRATIKTKNAQEDQQQQSFKSKAADMHHSVSTGNVKSLRGKK